MSDFPHSTTNQDYSCTLPCVSSSSSSILNTGTATHLCPPARSVSTLPPPTLSLSLSSSQIVPVPLCPLHSSPPAPAFAYETPRGVCPPPLPLPPPDEDGTSKACSRPCASLYRPTPPAERGSYKEEISCFRR